MNDAAFMLDLTYRLPEWGDDDPWNAVFDGCESPIERRMCVEISRQLGYPARQGPWYDCPDLDEVLREHGACVFGQQWVGHYRADFLIAFLGKDWFQRAWCAVECDGYEFHSSVEARAADSVRDRYFASQDITVIRFTGHEIVRRAGEVMGRIPERIGIFPTDYRLWGKTQRELSGAEKKARAL
jgi:very-short-patch-repair endonuclease